MEMNAKKSREVDGEDRERTIVRAADDDRKGRKRLGRSVEPPTPTDEEVDEFFNILKRMRVAVKYFERNTSKDGGVGRLNETPAAVDAADGAKLGENRGFDLNVVPEPESDLISDNNR